MALEFQELNWGWGGGGNLALLWQDNFNVKVMRKAHSREFIWDLNMEVAWIFEDISLICESFYFVSFVSVLLHFNQAVFSLISDAKENEEMIV